MLVALMIGFQLSIAQTANTTATINKGEVIQVECADCDSVAWVQFGVAETITPTVQPTETPRPTATLVPPPPPEDTLTPTAEPTAENDCLNEGEQGDYQDLIHFDGNWAILYPDGYLRAEMDMKPFDAELAAENIITWCFNPPETGQYNFWVDVYSINHNQDSFWFVVDQGQPVLVEWSTRRWYAHLAKARGNNEPIVIDAIKGDPVQVSIHPRESNARIRTVQMVPIGVVGQPVTAEPPTPSPSTPEPYPEPTEVQGYP